MTSVDTAIAVLDEGFPCLSGIAILYRRVYRFSYKERQPILQRATIVKLFPATATVNKQL